MTRIEQSIVKALIKPMTISELIKELRTDYGVKKSIDRLVFNGVVRVIDFKYELNSHVAELVRHS